MDPISTQWIIGGVTLVIGLIIGVLIGRSGNDSAKQESLLEQLHDTQQELADYKREVSTHFDKTAELVNQLTDSYKGVYQHLAQGAQQLGQGEVDISRLQSPSEALQLQEQPEAEPQSAEADATSSVEAPRDYAPKATPEDSGTLSESYGLKSVPKEEENSRAQEQSARRAV